MGEVRASLGATGGAARIQLIDDGEAVRVQTEAIDLETEQQIVRSLRQRHRTVIELTDVESVGPTFGRQIAGGPCRRWACSWQWWSSSSASVSSGRWRSVPSQPCSMT